MDKQTEFQIRSKYKKEKENKAKRSDGRMADGPILDLSEVRQQNFQKSRE